MTAIKTAGRLRSVTYNTHAHSHEAWEIVCYTEGSGTFRIDGEEHAFAAGDIYILPPGVVHREHSEEGFRDLFFTVKEPSWETGRYHHFLDTDGQTRATVTVLCNAFEGHGPNRERVVDAAYQLFLQLWRNAAPAVSSDPYVARLCAEIEAHLTDPDFSPAEVIAALHLSPNYARDLFSKHMGQTPLQWMTARRIERARQMLADRRRTGMSVRAIARACGFSDPYYFSRVFRKRMGISPKDV